MAVLGGTVVTAALRAGRAWHRSGPHEGWQIGCAMTTDDIAGQTWPVAWPQIWHPSVRSCHPWPDLAIPQPDLVKGRPGPALGDQTWLAAAKFGRAGHKAVQADMCGHAAKSSHGWPCLTALELDLAGLIAVGVVRGRRG